MNEPNRIDELCAAISVHREVDWDAEVRAAAGREDADLILQLAFIARMTDRNRARTNDEDLPFSSWGNLRLLSRIGAGSFGEVFRAWDEVLHREVALKLYRGRSSTAEVRGLAQIRHENVVQVHGFEVHQGRSGFWMDLVEGESLAAVLEREGVLDPQRAAEIGIAVCRALGAAHGAGVVHGDIKPSNVLCARDGRICLVDFGAGRALTAAVSVASPRIGTPMFMAPESVTHGELSERSDIYSVGVLLFVSLTGRYPVEANSLIELQQAHADRPSRFGSVPSPASPDPRFPSLASLRPGIRRHLVQTVGRCLAADPADRYEHAQDVEIELAHSVSGSRTRAWTAGIGVSVAVIAIVASMAYRATISRSAPGEARLVVAGFAVDPINPDSLAAITLTTLVTTGLLEANPCRVVTASRALAARQEYLGAGHVPVALAQATEVVRLANGTLGVVGSIRSEQSEFVADWHLVEAESGDRVHKDRVRAASIVGLADLIVQNAREAVSRHLRTPPTSTPARVASLFTASDSAMQEYQRALIDLEKSRWEPAFAGLERCVALDSSFALAHLALAQHRWPNWGQERAQASAEKAWAARSRLGLRDRLKAEAVVEGYRGRNDTAIKTYLEVVARWPDDIEAIHETVRGLQWHHRWGEALEVSTKGLQEFPSDEFLLQRRARILDAVGRAEEGLEHAQAMVRRRPTDANAWQVLGYAYLSVAMPDSAENAFHISTKYDLAPLEPSTEFPSCDFVRGRLHEAIAALEQGLARPDIPPEYRAAVHFAALWVALCDLYVHAGRFDDAIRAAEQTLLGLGDIGTQTRRRVLSWQVFPLIRSGRADTALNMWREWKDRSDLSPQDVWEIEAWRTLALVELDSLEAARASVNKLCDAKLWWFGPYRYRYFLLAAEIDLAMGLADSALVHADRAKDHGLIPGYLSFHSDQMLLRARALTQLGRHDEAEAQYQALTGLYGGLAPAWFYRATSDEARGDTTAARQHYERFLELYAQADADAPLLLEGRRRMRALH